MFTFCLLVCPYLVNNVSCFVRVEIVPYKKKFLAFATLLGTLYRLKVYRFLSKEIRMTFKEAPSPSKKLNNTENK